MHDHDHGHAHGHHHHGAPGRLLAVAFGLTLGFAAVEALGGWLASSLALLSDAGHMVTDATALALAAFAAWLSKHPPSAKHSYGLGRAEVIAALVNGVAMVAIVIGIVSAAVLRLQNPTAVSGVPVMIIAALGLALNVALALILLRGEQSLNVRGALLHVFGDLLGSVAALIAGAVIYFTGWYPIDPILSFLICILILVSALRLIRDSLHVIMEGVPSHLHLDEVGLAMAELAEIRSVHDLHIWTLSSGNTALSAHVVIDDLSTWQTLLPRITALLAERFGIEHVTIQPECRTHILHPAAELKNRKSHTHS